MLATPGPLPSGTQWAFEPKFDGIRLICDITEAGIRLTSRSGRDLTSSFPEVVGLGDALARKGTTDALLDGELVAAGVAVPRLGDIASRIHRAHPTPALIRNRPVRYVLFDLLRLSRLDLIMQPLRVRRAQLEDLLPSGTAWSVIDVFDDGDALWRATAEQGMEGVVAKRWDSRYRPGVRSADWVKSVHRSTQDLVIIGWRPQAGDPRRVGSLVVAQPRSGTLQPVGAVGSGMTSDLSQALLSVLPQLARPQPPTAVSDVPSDVRWVDPALVVAVRSLGRTSDGRLRQPTIVAIRPDLTLTDLSDVDLTSEDG